MARTLNLLNVHIKQFFFSIWITISFDYLSNCKAETYTALRWNIPLMACCVEDGYEADYWLRVIIAETTGLDCSTDSNLAVNLNTLEKELRAARRILRMEYLL